MKGLERFPEPWTVEERGEGWFVVKDASGFVLLGFKHRQDLYKISYSGREMYLNQTEGLALARAIARLPENDRRPQY